MPFWLQAVCALILFVGVVPLFVWANTGSLRAARYALKRYLLCVAVVAAPAALFCLVYWAMLNL
jgi:hypothetical protein